MNNPGFGEGWRTHLWARESGNRYGRVIWTMKWPKNGNRIERKGGWGGGKQKRWDMDDGLGARQGRKQKKNHWGEKGEFFLNQLGLHRQRKCAIFCHFSTFAHPFAYIVVNAFASLCVRACVLTWASFTVIWPLSRLPWKPAVTFHTRSPGRTRCTKLAGKYPTLLRLFP